MWVFISVSSEGLSIFVIGGMNDCRLLVFTRMGIAVVVNPVNAAQVDWLCPPLNAKLSLVC